MPAGLGPATAGTLPGPWDSGSAQTPVPAAVYPVGLSGAFHRCALIRTPAGKPEAPFQTGRTEAGQPRKIRADRIFEAHGTAGPPLYRKTGNGPGIDPTAGGFEYPENL